MLNAKYWGDSTALHAAAETGHTAAVQTLLAYGADVEARDDHGDTPLLTAAQFFRIDIVKTLLDHGVDISAENDVGFTALQMSALASPDPDIVAALLTHGANVWHRWRGDFCVLRFGTVTTKAALVAAGASFLDAC